MKSKLQLSSKVSNKVSVKHTLVYAAAGAGIFALLFIGAFFYFNLGTGEKVVAATEIKSVNSGNWGDTGIWNSSLPSNTDFILTIEEGHTITLNSNLSFTGNVEIIIKGTLIFANGKLTLETGSTILIWNGGKMEAISGGNNDHINIGKGKNGYTWKGAEINLDGPIELDKDGQKPILLPIVLDYFKATPTPTHTTLIEWSTFSEKDNDFFTLERSTDGKTFEIITTVDGAGNSSKKRSYRYEDTAPVAGMNYYRLKQTDFNGDFEYFKIVGVNHILAPTNKITAPLENISISNAWPNPFHDQINISFEAKSEGKVEVLVQNSLGQIVHKTFFPFHYGENTFIFNNADHLRPGVYFVNFWQNGKKYEPQRLVKM